MPLLEVARLSVAFPRAPALVEEVSFSLDAGQAVGLAGESGSGKTLSALAILGLLPEGMQATGSVRFDGVEVLGKVAALRKVRGTGLAMVFQDPLSSLNPVFTVQALLTEPLQLHRRLSPGDARQQCRALLTDVGLTNADDLLSAFPHQLSGGQRQRISIAAALAGNPRVLICDEPTTALDASVRVQVLELLRALQRERGLGLVLISHDLSALQGSTDFIGVLYAGRLIEWAPSARLFAAPAHPYSRGLLAARPVLGGATLPAPISGSVPQADARPTGCAFRTRCPSADEQCTQRPAWVDGHACHHPVNRP